MAFADPRSLKPFALPFYRVKLLGTLGDEKTIDIEAYVITSVKPHHVCLLVEPPRGGYSMPPEGVPAASPALDVRRLLSHVESMIKALEDLVSKGPGVKRAGPSIPGLLSRLFLGGRPSRVRVDDLEYRLAYSLCLDIFGDPPLKGFKLLGASLVWRVYRLEPLGGELWVVNAERGERDRKLAKILSESEEAKKKIFELAGLTS